ncbi:MAG: hypothetical protein KI790_01630 [Cyclobacteriaceae bacterium]|nr:hypothetical protein [Cyclobacteriaceae bacterium HetDA_MAG_MS6]
MAIPALTDAEIDLLSDKSFLLAKVSISKKVVALLSDAEAQLKVLLANQKFDFPEGTFTKSGKISKGERYRNLPYFVLDYPRLFTKTSVFAFRIMIWWGNEISFTLHMEGEALELYRPKLTSSYTRLRDYYISTGPTPWDYHFEKDNYWHIDEVEEKHYQQIVSNHPFLKVAQRKPISQLPKVSSQACSVLSHMILVISGKEV